MTTVQTSRPRSRATVTSVLGEILLTLGAAVLLYVVWQLWIGDVIYSAQHNAQAAEQSREWASVAPLSPAPEPTPDPEDGTPAYEPVILPQPADQELFAVMRVPRWGDDYAVNIAGGVTRSGTLDSIGIGHYLDTEMPGEVGNFGLAAHRTTFGKPFSDLQSLRIGDPIVIETKDGWYTYRFRTLEYVEPSAYDALADVPRSPDVPTGERYITLTTCSPRYAMTERLVGYGVFESYLPRSTGEQPAALTEELI
ncbi:class E sortase [Microbacterium sp.]|uniref:class E sortase n=1 Tax=Microbacterium sp. TaxID=51671 RepID=UPI0028117D65|nr:class E sortase [Microbacterium sp.]